MLRRRISGGAHSPQFDFAHSGGSWYDYARDCRSASRAGDLPGDLFIRYGFRVLLAPGQP